MMNMKITVTQNVVWGEVSMGRYLPSPYVASVFGTKALGLDGTNIGAPSGVLIYVCL
jgi:hypothetical protein